MKSLQLGFLLIMLVLAISACGAGSSQEFEDTASQVDSVTDIHEEDAAADSLDSSEVLEPDAAADSSEPDASADDSADIPDSCIPDCEGRECGDDGCGGTCGECSDPDLCVEGECTCVSLCDGKECGDDGCGGFCGECDDNLTCVDGTCQCLPDCQGKECGSDGCGGSCGECLGLSECIEGACVCEPDCADKSCGDDGCGGSCGECPGIQDECVEGKCVCQPDCEGKECGDDGCGGFCGHCQGQDACIGGTCVCQPDCLDKQCGPDGCGGSCGNCLGLDQCVDGGCQCVPMCDGIECGEDGCGGSCGECEGFDTCINGQCQCQPDCLGKVCGSNGCGGNCGECPEHYACIGGACYCQPDCTDKECGGDGCGGSCGTCSIDETCSTNGLCQCVPQCQNRECGPDQCGGTCGACEAVESCNTIGQCVCAHLLCGDACCAEGDLCFEELCCAPSCDGLECGGDGCGGSCGTCGDQHECQEGLCVCIPDCTDKVCGDDGCGGSCGECTGDQDACVEGQCVCQPACDGMECGADGCGAVCGTCQHGEVCTEDKLCTSDPLPAEFLYWVNYDSTSDSSADAFLGTYGQAGIRSKVQTQLQAIGASGAHGVVTRVRLAGAPETTPAQPGSFNVPPTQQQLQNLADYATDVSATAGANGNLRLFLVVEYEECADYQQGTPATTLGTCEWDEATWETNVYLAWTSLLEHMSTVYRPDGKPAVSLWYIDSDVKVAAGQSDPAKAEENRNQRWFLDNHYEALLDLVNQEGQNGSLLFHLAPNDEMASNRQYIDTIVPPISGRGSMYWVYRSLFFMVQNQIPRPERLDLAFYPSYTFQYGNLPTLVNKTFEDMAYLLPSIPSGPDTWGIVETWYPNDLNQRRRYAVMLEAERQEHPELQFVGVRPVPVPDGWTSPGAPAWGLSSYTEATFVQPFADHNGSFETDDDGNGLADGWETHWVQGAVSPWSYGTNVSTASKDGSYYVAIQTGTCGNCTEATDGVWFESDPVPIYEGEIIYVRFFERNSVTPWGDKPPADDYRGIVAQLIALDTADNELETLDTIGATYGVSQWHEHAMMGTMPVGAARVKVRFGLQQTFSRTVDFDWVR